VKKIYNSVWSLWRYPPAPQARALHLLTGAGSDQLGPTGVQIHAVDDAEAGLTFNEDGTVTGNSGCNGLGGTYTVEGDQVTFSEVVSTLMACDDPRMEQEDAFQQVLTDTASYKVEGNTLTLTNNNMVLVLTR
jgi:heat shock protein HslJ